MTLLSRMIRELVLVNDEVGLPGLGTFTAELMPASFSDKGFTINPPYRRLNFRQGESANKLLCELYASSNGIEAKTAEVIISKTMAELAETVKNKKVVIFPGLGRLRATRENDLFFVPEEGLDIYPEGEGLESVSLKSHIETGEEIASAVGSLAAELQKEPESAGLSDPAQKESEAAVAGETDAKPAPKKSLKFLLWLIPLILAILAVLALAAFMILCRTNPEFIDSILYTPEELRIINY